MLDHTNDLHQGTTRSGSVVVEVNALSDGIRVGKESLRESLVDHGNQRRVFIVAWLQETPSQEWCSHDPEVVGSNHIADGPVHVVRTSGFRLVLHPKQALVV